MFPAKFVPGWAIILYAMHGMHNAIESLDRNQNIILKS